MKYHSFLRTAQFRHVEYFFYFITFSPPPPGFFNPPPTGFFNPSPPGISILRLQASQFSASRPPQYFASRNLNPPPPGLLNPSPPGISILRLQASQPSASRHLYPLPTYPSSCISTSSYHPCPLHPNISLRTFQLLFSLRMYPFSDFSGTLSSITLIT